MARKPNTLLVCRKVPDHLRALREAAGLTQRGLAERLGKPQSWVVRSETAGRRADVAEWLEWVLGCGADPRAGAGRLGRTPPVNNTNGPSAAAAGSGGH
jgi:transcriptional regulator with XRE-family HTH domain